MNRMNKILITGASGFVGTKLRAMLSRDFSVIGTYYSKPVQGLFLLDITNKDAVREIIIKEEPDIVVHAAAAIGIDFCEQNRDVAENINHEGTRNVVDACREMGAKMFYISTSFVFDGKKENYKETDATNPLNWYGETKLMGERAILQLPRSVILRADFLYGYNDKDLPNGFFEIILSGEQIDIYGDEVRHPLFVDDVGNAIKVILEKDAEGVFHLAGPDRLTKYELALQLEKVIRNESHLVRAEENSAVKRPVALSLDTGLARSLGIYFTPVAEAAQKIKAQMEL